MDGDDDRIKDMAWINSGHMPKWGQETNFSGELIMYYTFAFSQAKHFFFSTSWKYRPLPIWLKTWNLKGYAAKYRYRKDLDVVRTHETRMNQTQEIKNFYA